MILMGVLNARLGNPRDNREEELATALADQVVVRMTDHFLPRRNIGVKADISGVCRGTVDR